MNINQAEHAYLVKVFNKPAINPLSADAIETVLLIQSIVVKAQRQAQENYESTSTQNGTTGVYDEHDEPNGNGEAEGARSVRGDVPSGVSEISDGERATG
jgi:hypothetical protein